MKRWFVWGVLLNLFWLAGCQQETKFGVVSGTVTDIDGNPVANAEVYVPNSPEARTFTLHNGTYYLTKVPEKFTEIRARARINDVEYTGRQVAQVFENEQSKSVNIMIAPLSRQGAVEGYVRDPLGQPIEGARVFAGGALSSALAVTDSRGYYRLEGLPGGYDYPIVASAPDYENDKRTVSVVERQTTIFSFTLNRAVNRPMDAPQNLSATAWTMPRTLTATRNAALRRAYDSIKALIDGETKPRRVLSRADAAYWIEIDLSWDYAEHPNLLGYGIYRGRDQDELTRNSIAFLRDPLADFFADLDPALQPNVTYYYEIVTVSSYFPPDDSVITSPRSNRASARPFVEIQLTAPRPNAVVDLRAEALTFSWTPVERADYYLVLIYDRFPDYQVQPYYPADLSNPGAAKVFAPNTSLVYTGPALSPGRTYYAVVLALSNDRSTRAISQLVPFQIVR